MTSDAHVEDVISIQPATSIHHAATVLYCNQYSDEIMCSIQDATRCDHHNHYSACNQWKSLRDVGQCCKEVPLP